MIKLRKIYLLLLVLLLSPIMLHPLQVSAAPSYAIYSGPYSEIHRQYNPSAWGATLSGNRWIHNSVNTLRSNWHQWMYDNNYDQEGWRLIIDAGANYSPPSGFEIQGIIEYDVHTPRTYPLSVRDCTEATKGLPTGTATPPYTPANVGYCHPQTFEASRQENQWAMIVERDHWTFDRDEATWEGKTGPYYLFNTAVRIGTAFDYRIKPIGGVTPPDPCKDNPNDPACGDGGGGEIEDPGPPPVDPPPVESCTIDESIYGGGTMGNRNMVAQPKGSILETSESSQFNVLRYGIPSSEFLRVEGDSEKYLAEYNYQNMTGQVTYRVKVTKDYMLRWQEGNKINYEHVRRDQYIGDSYSVSYWQIGHLLVMSFQDATFRNYALPNEMVIVPNFQRVSANSSHSSNVRDHVFPQNCQSVYQGIETIEGGQTKPIAPSPDLSSGAGIGSRPPSVKNDHVNVDGFTSMSDGMAVQIAPTPSAIPPAPKVRVSEASLQIDTLKVNKWETPSSITARYESVHAVNTSSGPLEFTGYSPTDINTVTVHTPVVMYGKASDDKEHDQRSNPPSRETPANPDTNRHAFILDRPFTVTLPTNGQHLDVSIAPGYGNRDYAKYTREKQVQFPFDVYTETKSAFYPKDTWINIPVDIESADFFMPVWVPEGEYTIKYRSVAINAPSYVPKEHHANLNLTYRTQDAIMENHVAYDTIEVDVVGRLYDFRVTDVLDFNWSSVFRTDGIIRPTGNHYWVGDRDIDGYVRGNEEPFVLPIRHGSHPDGFKNVAVKTGYQFKFDMKTKGDMWRENDAIRITPKFFFVDKTGQNRREVDVFYHNDKDYFVRIGSEDDLQYREITLNEPLRNVPESQVWNTGEFYYRHAEKYGLEEKASEHFNTGFIRYFDRDFSKRPTEIGPYGWQMLNWKLRTMIGPIAEEVPTNAMVPTKDAIASEQMWYGEYSLPADIYIVDQNTSIPNSALLSRLNKNHPIFLNDGYLIVNFNIESIQNGNVSEPHLQYIFGELSNQWNREGFKYEFVDPYGYVFSLIDGDVIFYHGDQSSLDDFHSGVTH